MPCRQCTQAIITRRHMPVLCMCSPSRSTTPHQQQVAIFMLATCILGQQSNVATPARQMCWLLAHPTLQPLWPCNNFTSRAHQWHQSTAAASSVCSIQCGFCYADCMLPGPHPLRICHCMLKIIHFLQCCSPPHQGLSPPSTRSQAEPQQRRQQQASHENAANHCCQRCSEHQACCSLFQASLMGTISWSTI